MSPHATHRHWLSDFAYRIEVCGWMFALTGVVAVAVAILTGQDFKSFGLRCRIL